MVKKKKILFICKHNLFRSQVAEQFFKKYNKKKNYQADSVGIVPGDINSILKKDKTCQIEREIAKDFGIKIGKKPKGISYSILNETDIPILVADDVPKEIIEKELFRGKLIVWEIRDLNKKDKKPEEVARISIAKIERKVNELIRSLK